MSEANIAIPLYKTILGIGAISQGLYSNYLKSKAMPFRLTRYRQVHRYRRYVPYHRFPRHRYGRRRFGRYRSRRYNRGRVCIGRVH